MDRINRLTELFNAGYSNQQTMQILHKEGDNISIDSVRAYRTKLRDEGKLNPEFANSRNNSDIPANITPVVPSPSPPKPIEISEKVGNDIVTIRRETEFKLMKSENDFLKQRQLSMEDVIKAIEDSVPAMPTIIPPRPPTDSKDKIDLDLVLFISDWHFNRTIDEREMEGFNSYSFEIAAARFWSMVVKTIAWKHTLEPTYNIKRLWTVYGGDMGNDSHRPENLMTNETAPMKAAVQGASLCTQGTMLLLQEFPEVAMVGICGNEARVDKKLPSKMQYNNYDWLIYQFIACALRNQPTFKTLIPVSPKVIVDISDHNILISHGHEVRAWAQTPLYGLHRMRFRELDLRRKKDSFDYWLVGHFHQEAYSQGIIMNGSGCGLDEYAKNSLGFNGGAQQTLLGFTKERGLECSFNLYLQDAKHHSFIYNLNSENYAKELTKFEGVTV